jgi:hypothetical protein
MSEKIKKTKPLKLKLFAACCLLVMLCGCLASVLNVAHALWYDGDFMGWNTTPPTYFSRDSTVHVDASFWVPGGVKDCRLSLFRMVVWHKDDGTDDGSSGWLDMKSVEIQSDMTGNVHYEFDDILICENLEWYLNNAPWYMQTGTFTWSTYDFHVYYYVHCESTNGGLYYPCADSPHQSNPDYPGGAPETNHEESPFYASTLNYAGEMVPTADVQNPSNALGETDYENYATMTAEIGGSSVLIVDGAGHYAPQYDIYVTAKTEEPTSPYTTFLEYNEGWDTIGGGVWEPTTWASVCVGRAYYDPVIGCCRIAIVDQADYWGYLDVASIEFVPVGW